MADWFMFRDFTSVMGEAIVRGGTAPSSTGYYLILCDSAIAANANIATVVGNEISGSGYARQNYAPSAGSFDVTDLRYEFPSVDLTFSASGGDLTFNAWVLLRDANSTVGNTTGGCALYYNYPVEQTISDGNNKIVTVEGWNFVRGASTATGAES